MSSLANVGYRTVRAARCRLCRESCGNESPDITCRASQFAIRVTTSPRFDNSYDYFGEARAGCGT
jgi:hypothetical protein